jgi:hypothetical protein
MNLCPQVSKVNWTKIQSFISMSHWGGTIAELVAHQPTEPKVEGSNLAQENSFLVGSWQFDDSSVFN